MPIVINEWIAEPTREGEGAPAPESSSREGDKGPPKPRAIEAIVRRLHERMARVRE